MIDEWLTTEDILKKWAVGEIGWDNARQMLRCHKSAIPKMCDKLGIDYSNRKVHLEEHIRRRRAERMAELRQMGVAARAAASLKKRKFTDDELRAAHAEGLTREAMTIRFNTSGVTLTKHSRRLGLVYPNNRGGHVKQELPRAKVNRGGMPPQVMKADDVRLDEPQLRVDNLGNDPLLQALYREFKSPRHDVYPGSVPTCGSQSSSSARAKTSPPSMRLGAS
jgi:hypothetical protein